MDYHGLGGCPASTQAEIATRYRVSARTLYTWTAAVSAAGARLPLAPEVITSITRRSTPAEDHLGRTRIALTFGLPRPKAPRPAPASGVAPPVPTSHRAAATIAVRVLAAVGPIPLPSLLGAVRRARRFRDRPPLTAAQLAAALLGKGATSGDDGLWHAPAGVTAPDRYRVIAAAMAGRELTRHQLIDVLIRAGYTPASASGRVAQTHPLIRNVRANRYCLIEPGFAAGPLQSCIPSRSTH